MRNATLLIVLILSGWLALPAQSGTNIKFDIQGLPNGYCRIIGMVGDQNYLADSILAQNGVATLQQTRHCRAYHDFTIGEV